MSNKKPLILDIAPKPLNIVKGTKYEGAEGKALFEKQEQERKEQYALNERTIKPAPLNEALQFQNKALEFEISMPMKLRLLEIKLEAEKNIELVQREYLSRHDELIRSIVTMDVDFITLGAKIRDFTVNVSADNSVILLVSKKI